MKITDYNEYKAFLSWLSSYEAMPSFSTMNIKLINDELTARILTTTGEVISLVQLYQDHLRWQTALEAYRRR